MLRFALPCLAFALGLPPSVASDCSDLVRVRYEPRTFLGYACDDDCQRHKVGFHWAEQHAVTDSGRCALLRRPEAEGCAAYVDEGQDAAAAGDRWAIENEIAHPCECRGAGRRFRAGCTQALTVPAARGLDESGCAKAWRGQAEPFRSPGIGR